MTDLSYDDAVKAGREAYQWGDYAEAAERFKEAHEQKPESVETLKMYGSSLARSNRAVEAEPYLLKAAETGPAAPEFFTDLTSFLNSTGEADSAIRLLTRVTQLWPENMELWRQLGEAHIAKKEFRLAADALDEALQRDPGNYGLAIRLASALGDVGDYQGVEYVLGHAEQLQPQGLPATRVHVLVSKKRRQWNFVGLGAKRLVEADPEDVGAIWRLPIMKADNAFFRRKLSKKSSSLKERQQTISPSRPDSGSMRAGSIKPERFCKKPRKSIRTISKR